jgi:uncharacterized protein YodC (DUF2158 family)
MTQKFQHGDVVRFADGNGKMLLWGDHVNIDHMFVDGYAEDGRVRTAYDNYTFQFPEEDLVKVGNQYDTRYNEEGNEEYIWLPELNETDEEDESTD